MKRTVMVALVIAAAAVTAFRLSPAAGANIVSVSDSAKLLSIEHAWNDALKAHDATWVAKHFAEDATDISSGDGSFHTKPQDIAAMKADKTDYESLELSDLQVRVEGNAGIVTGVNHLQGKDAQGQSFDVRLRFTDTYIHRKGQWLVWATQHTRIRE